MVEIFYFIINTNKSFSGYIILSWQFFCFRIWKRSLHSLLAWRVFSAKSTVIQISFAPRCYVIILFLAQYTFCMFSWGKLDNISGWHIPYLLVTQQRRWKCWYNVLQVCSLYLLRVVLYFIFRMSQLLIILSDSHQQDVIIVPAIKQQ